MAKLTSVAPDRPVSGTVYRPLSVPALLGFIIATAYGIVLAILIAATIWVKGSMIMPFWTLLIPLAAACLGFGGVQQIRRAEGTKSGEKLAAWSMWLGILLGLGGTAYYFGQYFAVWKQANDVSMTWFKNVREGKLIEAFLVGVDPGTRKFENPSNRETILQRYDVPGLGKARSALLAFRDNDIVRIVLEGGPQTQVFPIGVKSWEVDKDDAYIIKEGYKLNTPLGYFELSGAVRGTVGKEWEGRQWLLAGSSFKITGGGRTPLGELIEHWRADSGRFIEDWEAKLRLRDFGRAFLDTYAPAERANVQKEYQVKAAMHALLGSGSAAALLALPGSVPAVAATLATFNDQALARSILLPGYADFVTGRWMRTDQLFAPDVKEPLVKATQEQWENPTHLVMRPISAGLLIPVEDVEQPQTVRFDYALQFQVWWADESKTKLPQYLTDGKIVVESDPIPVREYVKQFLDNSLGDRKPVWHVARVELLRGIAPQETKAPKRPQVKFAPPRVES